VLWKNVCLLGDEQRECMVEMSRNKLKFYIVAVDLAIFRYHIIELWSAQAKKLMQACDGSLEKLMTYLEFRYGKLQIKDYDLLIQYQLYMPIELQKELNLQNAERNDSFDK
jgi:hypothetical protein